MLVSLTRLRLRSWWYMPAFLIANERAFAQLVRSAGFAGGKLLVDAHRTFWTITVWQSEKDMRAFRSSGAHSEAMRHLPRWCDEASVAHWNQGTTDLPAWTEAHERMRKTGRPSRVEKPSPAHERFEVPPPRLRPLIERTARPK